MGRTGGVAVMMLLAKRSFKNSRDKRWKLHPLRLRLESPPSLTDRWFYPFFQAKPLPLLCSSYSLFPLRKAPLLIKKRVRRDGRKQRDTVARRGYVQTDGW